MQNVSDEKSIRWDVCVFVYVCDERSVGYDAIKNCTFNPYSSSLGR